MLSLGGGGVTQHSENQPGPFLGHFKHFWFFGHVELPPTKSTLPKIFFFLKWAENENILKLWSLPRIYQCLYGPHAFLGVAFLFILCVCVCHSVCVCACVRARARARMC